MAQILFSLGIKANYGAQLCPSIMRNNCIHNQTIIVNSDCYQCGTWSLYCHPQQPPLHSPPMITRWFLSFVIIILTCWVIILGYQQHPFPTSVRNSRVVSQEHDLDICYATPSYINLFSPLDAPPLPCKLQDLPHVTTQILAPFITPTHLTKKWDTLSLENTTFHESYHPLSLKLKISCEK